jgi:hypothetical protein
MTWSQPRADPHGPDFDGMAGLFDRFTRVWDGIDRGACSDWVGRQLDGPTAAGDAGRERGVDLGCGAGRHLDRPRRLSRGG